MNELWEPDQDILRVYYKTSAAGSWNLLSGDITNISNWTEYTFTLPATSNDYYIAFESTEKFGHGVAIDDVIVEALPSCFPPIGLAIIATGQSTAHLSWTAPTTAPSAGYEWKIVLAGQGSGGAAQASGSTGAGVVTANATGLNPGTSYDLYVRSHCGGADYSLWTGPKNYKLYDDAPGAITLTVGAGCTGADFTNAGATKSNLEVYPSCSGAAIAPVWFRFVAPASGAVRVSTDTLAGTFIDSKLGLFSIPTPAEVTDYSKFTIISCDDDGGTALGFGFMGMLYATGLTPGTTYYIAVDKFTGSTISGTFCIAVDELNASMIAPANTCADLYQQPVGSNTYTGWVPLMNIDSKLVAMVQNSAGGEADEYTVSQNINNAAVRQDAVSKEYYLDRSFLINNSAAAANVNVQFFFLNRELTALHDVDAAAALSSLRVTRQTGSACQADFAAANGVNTDLTQTGNGTVNGVSWIKAITPGFSNFYIHSAKSPLIVKTFLQGAYSSALGRHKDVTTTWRNILNANALSQPYNTAAFGNYNGGETVPAGFFTSDAANALDILDWVLLEVKDGANVLVARRAALLREDGKIVDVTGDTLVTFNGLGSGNYYLTIRHRNHLGISVENLLPLTAKALGVAPPTSTYDFDFTTATDAAIFGTSVAYKIVGTKNVMICGNANGNNNVRYANLNNDPGAILVSLGGIVTAVVSNIYSQYDVNMDGIVRYANLNNDPGFLLSNALGGTVTLVLTEQKR
ncbi:MAG: fibronectin type III domain-containing protein [Bacteroidota bacterium]